MTLSPSARDMENAVHPNCGASMCTGRYGIASFTIAST